MPNKRTICWVFIVIVMSFVSGGVAIAEDKPRIAIFSGATATIQNVQPLVTSNKARERYGLPPRTGPDGEPLRFDHLIPQRLAAPVDIFIEAYTAHPLERDAAKLYAPPDGYLDNTGEFHEQRQAESDIPVYRVTLEPKDGLYLLPYMARQVGGGAWEGDCATAGAPDEQCRQPFFPDASRLIEEIDRGLSGLGKDGLASVLSTRANLDFYRVSPSGGYKNVLAQDERTDVGAGDIGPETRHVDFFAYAPRHLFSSVPTATLAKVTNDVQHAMRSGKYLGGIWLEGSPRIEETIYWLNLLIDTDKPLVTNAAQRANRSVSADGPANIIDSVDYIISEKWAGPDGKDNLGAVLVQDEQIIAARQGQKSDARPGGYTATGDHGGVIGTVGKPGNVTVYFRPATKHTWRSEVNLGRLPMRTAGVLRIDGVPERVDVRIKDDNAELLGSAIPRVAVIEQLHYSQTSPKGDASTEIDIMAWINHNLARNPLAGFVGEGTAPYGGMTVAQTRALEIAAFCGMPTVRVGRGNAGGLTPTNPSDVFVEGNNLTATKARLLLMAALMKYGSLPPAKDPRNPTEQERRAVKDAIAVYQKLFDTH